MTKIFLWLVSFLCLILIISLITIKKLYSLLKKKKEVIADLEDENLALKNKNNRLTVYINALNEIYSVESKEKERINNAKTDEDIKAVLADIAKRNNGKLHNGPKDG